MTKAEIHLLQKASKSGKYTHFALISGQDYCIRPIDDFVKFLSENSEHDFMNYVEESSRFSTRYTLYWPSFLIGRENWQNPIRKIYKFLGGSLFRSLLTRRNPPTKHFSYGSQWWVLRSEVVTWMLDEIQRDPHWLEYYGHSLNADESFFQTLYSVSPFAGQNRPYLTFVDWSDHGASPKTLTSSDYDELREAAESGEKYFARKFDRSVDENIINRLPFTE